MVINSSSSNNKNNVENITTTIPLVVVKNILFILNKHSHHRNKYTITMKQKHLTMHTSRIGAHGPDVRDLAKHRHSKHNTEMGDIKGSLQIQHAYQAHVHHKEDHICQHADDHALRVVHKPEVLRHRLMCLDSRMVLGKMFSTKNHYS